MNLQSFLTQDFPVLMAGLLASLACALIGAFLVLRRMSLMGDAISHAVLPGIIGAFLISKSLDSTPVFIGAAVIGVITAALSELVHRLGRVEPGASMGVVFTVLFAVGVILLSYVDQLGGGGVHLDAECVLYGAMEGVLWINPPGSWQAIWTPESWEFFPVQLLTLAIVLLLNFTVIVVLFKELRISSFDPGLATAQGINPNLMHYLLMMLVAITTVASFEAVGSILVVAMLIVPGMVAHLLTNRLAGMLALSAIIAAVASTAGYGAAVQFNTNSAGMIGVMLGVILALVALFAPRYGWLSRLRSTQTLEYLREFGAG